MSAIIKSFREVIEKAGYKFGIYSNDDWYRNVIPEDSKSNTDFWIAAVPLAKTEITEEDVEGFDLKLVLAVNVPYFGLKLVVFVYANRLEVKNINTKIIIINILFNLYIIYHLI